MLKCSKVAESTGNYDWGYKCAFAVLGRHRLYHELKGEDDKGDDNKGEDDKGEPGTKKANKGKDKGEPRTKQVLKSPEPRTKKVLKSPERQPKARASWLEKARLREVSKR